MELEEPRSRLDKFLNSPRVTRLAKVNILERDDRENYVKIENFSEGGTIRFIHEVFVGVGGEPSIERHRSISEDQVYDGWVRSHYGDMSIRVESLMDPVAVRFTFVSGGLLNIGLVNFGSEPYSISIGIPFTLSKEKQPPSVLAFFKFNGEWYYRFIDDLWDMVKEGPKGDRLPFGKEIPDDTGKFSFQVEQREIDDFRITVTEQATGAKTILDKNPEGKGDFVYWDNVLKKVEDRSWSDFPRYLPFTIQSVLSPDKE